VAPRCHLAVSIDPADDFTVLVAVGGSLSCLDLVGDVLASPPLPDGASGLGKCPEGHACLDGKIF